MFVLPKEVSEREQGQVVVGTLEAGEAGDDDDDQKQFLDMLQHLMYRMIYEKFLYSVYPFSVTAIFLLTFLIKGNLLMNLFIFIFAFRKSKLWKR